MTIFNLPCLVLSALLSVSSHASFRADTIVVADSIPPLLTEPTLQRLLVFAQSIKEGQEQEPEKGKHCNSLLIEGGNTDANYELIPVSVPIDSTVKHFKLHRINIATAAAHDSSVAAALKRATLTPEQVQGMLLSIFTAEVTIWTAENPIGGNIPKAMESISPTHAATVPWRNVQFVKAHPTEIRKLWWESGLPIGYGELIRKNDTGIYKSCLTE